MKNIRENMYGRSQTSSTWKVRQSQRTADIAESQQLLWELAIAEPTIQQCFGIIESTCLSQGIYCKVDGKQAKDEFLEHLQEYYTSFCRAAIRAMCVYGFVPWKTRKLQSGDEVPEVLAAGTFTWHTEPRHKDKPPRAKYFDAESMMVIYRISPLAGIFKEEEVNMYVSTQPSLDVMNNSILYATIQSPLAHILTDYKALRQAQIRRSHADAWNCTAKVITQFSPKLRVEDNPSQYLMDFVHEDFYAPPPGAETMYPPVEAHNVWQRENVIRRQFQTAPSVHYPEVFALPRDHTIAQQTRLDPCENIEFLLLKYRRDVCSLLGIPFEMIAGKEATVNDSSKKTLASGRIFSTKMQDYCRHLQKLLGHVYKEIYGGVGQFLLVPMPRLEISCMEDLKTLHEIGALTPDMSMQLSKTLLGENQQRKKMRLGDKEKEDKKTTEQLEVQ